MNMSAKEFKMKLKNTLCGYRSLDTKTERKLRDLGFITERTSNHVVLRIIFQGKKFQFVMSKTASDVRAGYKQTAVIYRTLFGNL